MRQLLHFNPDKRLTAEEALKHPYVAKFHNPAEEILLQRDVVPPLSDDVQLSVSEYRNNLYEVKSFYLDKAGLTHLCLNFDHSSSKRKTF